MDHNPSSKRTASQTVAATRVITNAKAAVDTDQPQFLPGVVLAKRYRIVELLGRGGMGDVFRADDLKLGHSVALKFLSLDLANDPAAMARLRGEVRVARQVSHPNVCRVYDLSEAETPNFITMEHVDGEDLASIFRRLGRPTKEKALQIARQLCAGLAAAHERGVLHLDLKPANLMIDGRGQVRIMDFGVAAFVQEIRSVKGAAGTPGYMAPEQLAGGAVSARSDIYSLGLVLYELFTGQRAFRAESIDEWKRVHAVERPAEPSSLVDDLDPSVEQVILRCLEKDPEERPPSAMAVMVALPRGDPLAEMLAAGETPSPEMVAAAGGEGGFGPRVAAACLGAVLLGLLLVALLNNRVALHRLGGPGKPAVVLADRAREIMEQLGYTSPPVDRRYGFFVYGPYLKHLELTDKSPDRWRQLGETRPTPYKFWYRESPAILAPNLVSAKVSVRDPPLGLTGMALMTLDGQGRLEVLYIVPPQMDQSPQTNAIADYSPLFEAAELDETKFAGTESIWNPDFYADERIAWLGEFPGRSNWPVRIEAAAYRGRPIYFRILEPPDKPWRHVEPRGATTWKEVLNNAEDLLLATAIVGALVVARRNLRLGRGDRRGAERLGVAVFLMSLLFWLLWTDHVRDVSTEVNLLLWAVFKSISIGVVAGLGYLALEPYTRRLWPALLVSWTRLLMGQVRNPRVGRDVLVGLVAGVSMIVVQRLEPLVSVWLGALPRVPYAPSNATLQGGRQALAILLDPGFVTIPIVFVIFLALFRHLLRRQWLATLTVLVVAFIMDSHWHWDGVPDAAAVSAIGEVLFIYVTLLFVLVRFGLLSGAVSWFLALATQRWPLTLDLSAWYAGTSFLFAGLLAGIAFWAYHTSLRGRSLSGTARHPS
jgi:serine/threonine-protein kinase